MHAWYLLVAALGCLAILILDTLWTIADVLLAEWLRDWWRSRHGKDAQ